MKPVLPILLIPFFAWGQYAPPAGQAGTSAMYKDSSAFVRWASACTIIRGLQDISNTGSGYATAGDSSKATGIADNGIVSLGDGGMATCTFDYPLTDGPGFDFAVFENSFSDDYLEFGFVEVSSDGVNFTRFQAATAIQDTLQTGSFDLSDAAKVNNFAGKYRGLYGTPFDLQELQGAPGLNVNSITHVRIIDVVGSINAAYATFDSQGHKVNDPWPTAFPSSGFDLDAVGVIHDVTNTVNEADEKVLLMYPVPLPRGKNLRVATGGEKEVIINLSTAEGIVIKCEYTFEEEAILINTAPLDAGLYTLSIKTGGKANTSKFVVMP